ncbi:MAG TPA: ABC transporter permease [Thermoanaerobaculia bacterium]|nr:ABC transporter permease [Thermoanaerobaculia bacterium]
MLRAVNQIAQISLLNLRNLPARAGSSLVAVIGIAGVVAILVAVLSIAAGFRETIASTGAADRAVVLRQGSTSEMVSFVGGDSARLIKNAPGVRFVDGTALASAELFVIVDLPKLPAGTPANVPLRGVEPAAFAIRKELKMVEGRPFRTGTRELIAGKSAALSFAGLEVGSTLRLAGNDWQVVGIFETGGTLTESELWCDARVLQPTYRRGNSFQAIYVQLESEAALAKYRWTLDNDPRLDVAVERESDYYAGQSQVLTDLITSLGLVIGIIMGAGAAFGALNTMYTAVSSRTREIATLRAVGFQRLPIVVSVMVEAVVLGLVGGAIGAAAAWWMFDGFRTSTMNWQSFSQVAFAFRVTPDLLVLAVAYALVLGLIGGILPAIKAARLPVATALREL